MGLRMEGWLGGRDCAETSLLFSGLQIWLAKGIDAEYEFSDKLSFLSFLQSHWKAKATREPHSVRKQ